MSEASLPLLLVDAIHKPPSRETTGWVPPDPDVLKDTFPQLEIQALIGHGGMGAVYKARQTHLERLVAVKLLSPERSADPAFIERFTREARALARLQHPHIVTLFDFGRAGPWLYLVMEYVEGANLRQLMATGRLDPSAAINLAAPLCDALIHAHAQGVVHRDLKPENILIGSQGQPKIADFGLAKLCSVNGDLTQTGDTLGTLHYMSPEQISGTGDIDHRADVYALGVILYEMLTGNLPLGRCVPPSQSGSDPRLDEVVLRSLEREPDKRWQSVEELRQAVAQIQGNMSAGLHPKASISRSQRSLWAWGLALAAIITIIAFMWPRPTPLEQRDPPIRAKSPRAEAHLDEALEEARRLETLLGAMDLRKAELERKIAELDRESAQTQTDASKVSAAIQAARMQQTQLTEDVDRLITQRQVLAQQFDDAMKSLRLQKEELTSEVESLTKQREDLKRDTTVASALNREEESARNQQKADILAVQLLERIPGPFPPAPIRLELHYDRETMSTIGRVIHSDGTTKDLQPVPWPRDGAKVLVSSANEEVGRLFTDLVIAHSRTFAQRQRLIGELVVHANELKRLDASGRHADLIADLQRLSEEMP